MKPKVATKRAAIILEPYSFPTIIAATAALDLVALAEAEVPDPVPDAAPAEVGVDVGLAWAEEADAVAVKLAISRVPHLSLMFVVQLSWEAWSFGWSAMQRP
jgi:hypothetical protein